jgi:hypothetical protein
MDQAATISLAFNVALAVLLTVSEALPFIKSRDYNGLLDFIVRKLGKKGDERSGIGTTG